MKKALLVLAGLCLVFALSCASTEGGGGGAGASLGPIAGAGNLGAFELVLKDNWANGRNFQAELQNPALLNGHRLARGETYTLKISYVPSRDTQAIGVGFADMTPWSPLSFRQPGGIDIPNTRNGGTELPAAKAGETVTAEVTITLLSNASGAAARANTLIFATLGAQSDGPVTLNVSEFSLTRN
ncbi:MAG: hypothetical protein FWD40_10240 [Treponema sp.]|nr:hypothetical protein [Treponema sp.]